MRVVENTHPQVAFNRLGHVPDNVLLITVEDQLLAVLVRVAMKLLDPGEAEIIRLHIPTSGANSILKYNIPTWMSDHQVSMSSRTATKNLMHRLQILTRCR